ncbi:hypothetical protein GCM10028801_01890 [Nocardioides maradonensis]
MLLKRIGYWGDDGTGLPSPAALVDESWDEQERELVADHLARGFVARAYLGNAICRICGEKVGSLELTDGTYLWPEGLVHYVTVHHVRLPASFVDHVHSFMDAVEAAEVDETWWRSVGR